MKKFFSLIIIVGYISIMSLVTGCSREPNELKHDHAHEHGHEHNHGHNHNQHQGHDHGSGDEIILNSAQADKMGVKVVKVHADDFANVIKATGRFTAAATGTGVVSAPTAGILDYVNNIAVGQKVTKGQTLGRINTTGVTGGDKNAVALANLNKARQELDRLKPLYDKQLVTAEKYNAALADYEIAKAQYSPVAASGTIVSPLSGIITEILAAQGQFVDAGTEIAMVADGSELSLTVDIPDKYAAVIPEINSARVIVNGSSAPIDLRDLNARKVSTVALNASQGYIPVVFTMRNDGSIVPGSIVEVYLMGGSRQNVVSVPIGAITEQQGNYFVFVKVDDEGYIKSPVRLGASDGYAVEILSGLHIGDNVVVEGVTALRLAETSGAIPEGHSHSH